MNRKRVLRVMRERGLLVRPRRLRARRRKEWGRVEASRPNEIWQADHTPLDLWVRDERNRPARPWLTVILDDHRRAVAGFRLNLSAPSALQTALKDPSLPDAQRVLLQIKLAESKRALSQRQHAQHSTVTAGTMAHVALQIGTKKSIVARRDLPVRA